MRMERPGLPVGDGRNRLRLWDNPPAGESPSEVDPFPPDPSEGRSTWSALAERMVNHLPSTKVERPTSELLIQAADGLGAIIRDGKYRWNFDALIRELRNRAATFKTIEE
jgi:hypothetical protein